jgi:hypothetical protein
MQITVNDEGQTAHVALVGRLDIKGAEVIDMPLATLSGAKQNILIDMSQVSFLASIGIRHRSATRRCTTRPPDPGRSADIARSYHQACQHAADGGKRE